MARPRQEAASVPLSSVTEREWKPALKRTDQRDAIFAALCEAICPVYRAQELAAFDAANPEPAINDPARYDWGMLRALTDMRAHGDAERIARRFSKFALRQGIAPGPHTVAQVLLAVTRRARLLTRPRKPKRGRGKPLKRLIKIRGYLCDRFERLHAQHPDVLELDIADEIARRLLRPRGIDVTARQIVDQVRYERQRRDLLRERGEHSPPDPNPGEAQINYEGDEWDHDW